MPFELGRPFGVPNDAAFQRRVLIAALELLDRESGPVLVDYREDVPADAVSLSEDDITGMVCPIDLPKIPDENAPKSELGRALMAEIDSLAPWYDLAVRTRGRTTVGPSGLELKVAAKFFADFLEDQDTPAPRDDLVKGRVLKLAYEDIKAYYGEAITAQPGFGTSLKVEHWMFNETVFGRALWTLRRICRESDDEYYQYLGRNSIVPDRQVDLIERAVQVAE